MLIEKLALNNYKVISANTDGLLLHIKKEELEKVRELYKEWEVDSGFTLEENYFSKYVRRDINSYAALTTYGERKTKGLFLPQGGILKGFEFPVIAKALQAYYFDGVDPEVFLYEYKDIYDFCMSQKIGGQFVPHLYSIRRTIITHNEKGKEYTEPRNIDEVLEKTEQQKTLRFFVSRPAFNDDGSMSGHILKKVKRETKPVKVLVKEKEIIPAEYIEEHRINPDSGRMKKYKTKVRDRTVIPAEYIEEIQEVETESVLASGSFITLFNDYYDVADFGDYNIDYDYYVQKCRSEIAKINNGN